MFVTQTLTPIGSPGARQLVFCNSIRIEVIVRSGRSCDPDVDVAVGVGVRVKVGVMVGVRVGVTVGPPGV